MTKLIYCCIVSLVLLVVNAKGDIPPDFCVSKAEYKLYTMINEHRTANDLPELSLSISLSYVAVTHVADLVNNNPDTSICNLNSWSNKGDWTPCCHNNYVPKSECILGKPRELTNYRGEGHELAYWEPVPVNPDSLLAFWTSIKETNDFLLNLEQWDKYKWRAVGIGILEGYAVIWVGELPDREGLPGICVEESKEEKKVPVTVPLVTTKYDRYYVICASYETEKDAMAESKSLLTEGYEDIKVVQGDQNFRVSLGDFKSLDEAKAFKTMLGNKFRNVWILNF